MVYHFAKTVCALLVLLGDVIWHIFAMEIYHEKHGEKSFEHQRTINRNFKRPQPLLKSHLIRMTLLACQEMISDYSDSCEFRTEESGSCLEILESMDGNAISYPIQMLELYQSTGHLTCDECASLFGHKIYLRKLREGYKQAKTPIDLPSQRVPRKSSKLLKISLNPKRRLRLDEKSRTRGAISNCPQRT